MLEIYSLLFDKASYEIKDLRKKIFFKLSMRLIPRYGLVLFYFVSFTISHPYLNI